MPFLEPKSACRSDSSVFSSRHFNFFGNQQYYSRMETGESSSVFHKHDQRSGFFQCDTKCKTKIRKMWSKMEMDRIAMYILEQYRAGNFNKRNIKGFIERMSIDLQMDTSYKQIRNCYEKMEYKYKQVQEWIETTGSKLRDNESGLIDLYIEKHCPQYRILKEAFDNGEENSQTPISDSLMPNTVDYNALVPCTTDCRSILEVEFSEMDAAVNCENEEMVEFRNSKFTESFTESVNKQNQRYKRKATFMDELDSYAMKKIEFEREKFEFEKQKHLDLIKSQVAVEENKLNLEKYKLELQFEQLREQSKRGMIDKILDMQLKYDTELLKMGKEPDLTYGQKLMKIFGVNQIYEN